jgi:hypothetical protein
MLCLRRLAAGSLGVPVGVSLAAILILEMVREPCQSTVLRRSRTKLRQHTLAKALRIALAFLCKCDDPFGDSLAGDLVVALKLEGRAYNLKCDTHHPRRFTIEVMAV